MPSKPLLSKTEQKQIARERIDILFEQAALQFPKNKALANRYVTLARKIAMKVRMPIPREYKRRFCKHCYTYFQPGVNSRVRITKGKVTMFCAECKNFTRIPVR